MVHDVYYDLRTQHNEFTQQTQTDALLSYAGVLNQQRTSVMTNCNDNGSISLARARVDTDGDITTLSH
jgi:hypothetical protein